MQPSPTNPNTQPAQPELQAAIQAIGAEQRLLLELYNDATMLDGLDGLRERYDSLVQQSYIHYYDQLQNSIKASDPKSVKGPAKHLLDQYMSQVPSGADNPTRVSACNKVAHEAAIERSKTYIMREIEDDYLPGVAPGIEGIDDFEGVRDAVFSAVQLGDEEWYGVDEQDDDGNDVHVPGMRDKLEVAIALQQSSSGQTLETEPEVERLEQLRNAKYEAFVARMKGPVFGGKKKRALKEAYEDAERAYMVALGIQNKRKIEAERAKLEAAGKTEDEIVSEVKEYAKGEIEKILEDDQEEQHKLLVERSGKMGEFLKWYGNEATLAKKVALGIGLGALTLVGGAGIGFAAGMFGGLVGVGIVSGATFGLTRSWGVARTYQLRMAELYKFPTHHEKFEIEDDATVDSLHLKQRKFLETTSREQLEQGDKVKKRAVIWSVGAVAVGSALGAGAHMLADSGLEHGIGGQVQHWLAEKGVKAPWDHTPSNVEDVPTGGDTTPDPTVDEIPDRGDAEIPPPEAEVTQPVSVELWNGAPTEHVLQKAYPGLNDSEAYLRINELYDKFGSNGVFKGATLSEHSPNDIWINENSGTVQLTPQAQEYLDSIHGQSGGTTTEVVNNAAPASVVEILTPDVEQAVNELVSPQAKMVAANTVGGNEGWYQTFNELRSAGVINIGSENYGHLLSSAGPELAKLSYSDGTPVAYWDRFAREWRMYDSPDGRLHPEAIRLLARLSRQDTYGLAA